MDQIEKLAKLVPHWIEHNEAHAAQFADWSERALEAGLTEVAGRLAEAADALAQANQSLELARGGLAEGD